ARPGEGGAGLQDDVGHRKRALKNAGAVRLCENRLFERVTDFSAVDVEGRHKLDIAALIAADGGTHDAFDRGSLARAIVFDALNQGTGAIADAGNGYFNFLSHRHAILFVIRFARRSARPSNRTNTRKPMVGGLAGHQSGKPSRQTRGLLPPAASLEPRRSGGASRPG